jgi:tetratricopeptide (TPR) repeat protein
VIHYDPETLVAYLEGNSPIAGQIEAHAARCAPCATELAGLRGLIATLENDVVWDDERRPLSFFGELAAFADEMHDEQARAAVLCHEILAGPPAWWAQHVRKKAGTRAAGVVRQLLARMRATLESAPTTALQMTALAVDLAAALDPLVYPRPYILLLHGQALRSHAVVLTFLGGYQEGLAVAERARTLFLQVAGTHYERARVDVVVAMSMRHLDRTAEAAALLRAAGQTFLAHGDREWYVNARITEGATWFNGGAYETALEVWQSVEGAPELDALGTVRVAHNIALCLAELGRAPEAIEMARMTIAEFEHLGHLTERTRSRMLLGRALLAAGRASEAVPVLRRTRREYQEVGMPVDAGETALTLAEALLATGHPEEVPTICRELIAEFTKAGLQTPAVQALAFLHEALALGNVSPTVIREARVSLVRRCAQQPRVFAPGAGGGVGREGGRGGVRLQLRRHRRR